MLATHEGRDLLLERGAAVREAWTAGADFSKVAATLDDVIVFFMDIDTAEVSTLIDDEPLNLAAHPRIADIATRIDGDLLDSIGQLWYRSKGLPDSDQAVLLAKEIEIKGWSRGQMLAWDEIFTHVRQDLYVHEGRLYEAAEMYCSTPDCACGEVSIYFGTLRPRGAPSPGRIVVQRSGAAQIEPHKNGRERLEQLWAAFRRRHPNHLARFARRYPTIKRISAKIVVTQPAVSTKFGRNDSCPRGSGKKYKKCCGTI